MNTNRLAAFLIVMTLSIGCSQVLAQQQNQVPEPKDSILPIAVATGYKGGLPFYTAFHQEWTTRLLLLKTVDDVPELREHLGISKMQAAKISNLELHDGSGLTDAQRSTLLDANIAIDEERANPKFYAFLTDAQREKLDRLSLEFDGAASLSRVGIADRLRIAVQTRKKISATLVRYREELYLPYFRHCFAAKLPKDHKFRDCEFSGRYLALLNQAILDHLSPAELKRFKHWAIKTSPPKALIDSIKTKAPLPKGLFSLAEDDGE